MLACKSSRDADTNKLGSETEFSATVDFSCMPPNDVNMVAGFLASEPILVSAENKASLVDDANPGRRVDMDGNFSWLKYDRAAAEKV